MAVRFEPLGRSNEDGMPQRGGGTEAHRKDVDNIRGCTLFEQPAPCSPWDPAFLWHGPREGRLTLLNWNLDRVVCELVPSSGERENEWSRSLERWKMKRK